jgi:hypothetical protein
MLWRNCYLRKWDYSLDSQEFKIDIYIYYTILPSIPDMSYSISKSLNAVFTVPIQRTTDMVQIIINELNILEHKDIKLGLKIK